MTFHPPGDCPVCGEEVEAGARACPACGACPQSGWHEEEEEDERFDYEAFLESESASPDRLRYPAFWWFVAVGLLWGVAAAIFHAFR